MKILVPVDGSSASINAVKKSIKIAKYYNFSIKLISVIQPATARRYMRNESLWRQTDGSAITGRKMKFDDDEFTGKMQAEANEMLDSIISKLNFEDVKVEKEILVGEPHDKILETAENENFDLIIMSNRGYSSIKNFFLGSVAQRVIAESKCPVLIFHSDLE